MKRILFHANCQALGLIYFLKRHPAFAETEFRIVQNYQLILKEITPEYERESLAWADFIFFHHMEGKLPWPEDSVIHAKTRIPLAVAYNGGAFIRNAEDSDWPRVIEIAKAKGKEEAATYAVHDHDFNFAGRLLSNLHKMRAKERHEGVHREMRISDFVTENIDRHQLFLTMNHPTSLLFYTWTNRILKHLGFEPLTGMECECLAHPNLVNLPCEDFASAAAKRILGLQWGGDERSNNECWRLVHEKLEHWGL